MASSSSSPPATRHTKDARPFKWSMWYIPSFMNPFAITGIMDGKMSPLVKGVREIASGSAYIRSGLVGFKTVAYDAFNGGSGHAIDVDHNVVRVQDIRGSVRIYRAKLSPDGKTILPVQNAKKEVLQPGTHKYEKHQKFLKWLEREQDAMVGKSPRRHRHATTRRTTNKRRQTRKRV